MSNYPKHKYKDNIGQDIHIGDIIVQTGASSWIESGIVNRFTEKGCGIAGG